MSRTSLADLGDAAGAGHPHFQFGRESWGNTPAIRSWMETNDDASRRRELVGQLERLRDLYVMGDLSKSEYVLRRQALEGELSRTRPPFDPRLDNAEEVLADVGRI